MEMGAECWDQFYLVLPDEMVLDSMSIRPRPREGNRARAIIHPYPGTCATKSAEPIKDTHEPGRSSRKRILPPLGVGIVSFAESVQGIWYASVSLSRIRVAFGWLPLFQFADGIVALAVGWGLWDLETWARTTALVVGVVDIVIHLRYFLADHESASAMVITVIIEATIHAYLVMPHTKAYFTKGTRRS